MYPPGQGLVLAVGAVAGSALDRPIAGNRADVRLRLLDAPGMVARALGTDGRMSRGPAHWNSELLDERLLRYFAPRVGRPAGARSITANKTPRRAWAMPFLMSAGVAILANTRPYEGLVFCVPIALAIVIWIATQKKFPTATVLRRVAVPVILILGVTGAAMSYYFWRVTGMRLSCPIP